MKWIPLAGGAIAGFALCWLIHLVILSGVEKAHEKALNDQKISIEKTCADDKAITEKANDEYQKQNSIISGKLAKSKRLQQATCIVPKANVAELSTSRGEYARSNGITTSSLFDYAADCESYRQQRIIIDQFKADWDNLNKGE